MLPVRLRLRSCLPTYLLLLLLCSLVTVLCTASPLAVASCSFADTESFIKVSCDRRERGMLKLFGNI